MGGAFVRWEAARDWGAARSQAAVAAGAGISSRQAVKERAPGCSVLARGSAACAAGTASSAAYAARFSEKVVTSWMPVTWLMAATTCRRKQSRGR